MVASEWVPLSEVVRNLGLTLAGVVGVVFGAFRVVAASREARASLRQAELARRAHVAELMNRAVGQLDDPRMHVRLGAILTLREVTRDFPDLTKAVSELLTVHLREAQAGYGDQLPPPDIREIMRMLRERFKDER